MLEYYTSIEGDYIIVSVYAHSGNKYHYYKIDDNGYFSIVDGLNRVVKNDYYLNDLSVDQLCTIQKLEALFNNKYINKVENKINKDDIPF